MIFFLIAKGLIVLYAVGLFVFAPADTDAKKHRPTETKKSTEQPMPEASRQVQMGTHRLNREDLTPEQKNIVMAMKEALKFREDKDLVSIMLVTPYYGPERGQANYFAGSYEKEVEINGQGIRTSSGEPVKIGHAAADLNYYPYGTVLEVPGWGEVVVKDTGSAIKGPGRLDVFVGWGDDGYERAKEFKSPILVVKIKKLGAG